MPIHVDLIHQDRAVRQTYQEPVTAADLDGLRDLMQGVLLPAAGGKLHIIADFRQVHQLPDIILRNGLRMLNHAHPKTGVIVFVAQDRFIATMAAVFMRFYPSCAVRLVDTIEEAEAIIDALLTTKTNWCP